ncbi:hypothetical protein STEG23_024612, partial [Scotinomys teguina]
MHRIAPESNRTAGVTSDPALAPQRTLPAPIPTYLHLRAIHSPPRTQEHLDAVRTQAGEYSMNPRNPYWGSSGTLCSHEPSVVPMRNCRSNVHIKESNNVCKRFLEPSYSTEKLLP